jgi:hypothetical protein
MVLATAQAWFWAIEGADAQEDGQSWSAQRLAEHRAAVVEAAGRISDRVRGPAENALMAMDMHAYAFRPGWIRPVHGETSRTRWCRLCCQVLRCAGVNCAARLVSSARMRCTSALMRAKCVNACGKLPR